MVGNAGNPDRYKAVTMANVSSCPQWEQLGPDQQEAIRVVGSVLPFRANHYVMDQLIDWDSVPNDPIFQLTFPQRDMLTPEHYEHVATMLKEGVDKQDKPRFKKEIDRIRYELNPHPAGQMTHNVPMLEGEPLDGIQHKYEQTMLYFPSQGQTCHAYCSFCFRWAQFVGLDDLKFSNKHVDQLVGYLQQHPEITDVLFTGGDPMIMKSAVFQRYIEPLVNSDGLDHIRTIRIGTKSLGYWPQRFVTDPDADHMIDLFRQITDSGMNLAIMAHTSHPVEFSTDIAEAAIQRVRSTGANIRMQSPLIKHVNDDPDTWANLWQSGVELGCIPYYMFVERDTGARHYFAVPLVRCWEIFRDAYQQVSGIARTVRGPSMSAFPGKVHVLGVTECDQQKAFMLEYLQCRDPELVRQPFFARFDPNAAWFDQLQPLRASDERFFKVTGETSESDPASSVIRLHVDQDVAI